MLTPANDTAARWRALFVLGRFPSLPTVWSNGLAAWLLAGDGPPGRLLWLLLGTSLLHVGGMYLNDYFDEAHDRAFRKDRPIPSGRIPAATVGRLGGLWLLMGTVVLLTLAATHAWLTLALAGTILACDALHKATVLAPLLIGACRFLLYLVAGSAAADGINGLLLWCAIAMACYVAGTATLARHETTRQPVERWPVLLLAAPLLLAWIANRHEFRQVALWLSLVLVLWLLPCLRHAFRGPEPNVGLTVAGLGSGIVLVDLLAVAGYSPLMALAFGLLFLATIVAQRFLPNA
ncbi:MAG TPA: UbiA family prenyltransferase [Verrucomicrobiota bacterium]|nr:UbiA family prenyltransferase [Verrucomicrobiota bacterium]HNU51462.1 UbiA family prenyltransferase [Verrucomicrobiota bacterium]